MNFTVGSTNATIKPINLKVAIYHGIPAKVNVKLLRESPEGQWTQNADSLIAGECYALSTKVTDAADQEIDTLAGTAISKLGAKNFSVSNTYRNFSGGFYLRSADPPYSFSQHQFSNSDSIFASNFEYTARIPLYTLRNRGGFEAGGYTFFRFFRHSYG